MSAGSGWILFAVLVLILGIAERVDVRGVYRNVAFVAVVLAALVSIADLVVRLAAR